MSGTQNQFSLTRAASINERRAKKQILIIFNRCKEYVSFVLFFVLVSTGGCSRQSREGQTDAKRDREIQPQPKLQPGLQNLLEAAERIADKNSPGAAAGRQKMSESLSALSKQLRGMGMQLPQLDEAIAALAANQTDLFLKDLQASLTDLEKLRATNQVVEQNFSPLEQQIYEYVQTMGEDYERKFGIAKGEALVSIAASKEFNMTIVEVCRIYDRIDGTKSGLHLTDAEIDALNMVRFKAIGFVERGEIQPLPKLQEDLQKLQEVAKGLADENSPGAAVEREQMSDSLSALSMRMRGMGIQLSQLDAAIAALAANQTALFLKDLEASLIEIKQRRGGLWYFEGQVVNMGRPLPTPESMRPKQPEEGKQLEVTIEAEAVVSDLKTMQIRGKTNLPDETAVTIDLSCPGTEYSAGDTAVVLNGRFESGSFSDRKRPLHRLGDGEYLLEISTPIVSVLNESVRKVLGEGGRNMTGKLVKFDEVYGNRVNYSKTVNVGIAKHNRLPQ